MGTIFGALPGWWSGVSDGRALSPCIHLNEWHRLLLETGFSGCDTATPVLNSEVIPMSAFVSQAIDDRLTILRAPLKAKVPLLDVTGAGDGELVLLGGNSSLTSKLITELKKISYPHWSQHIKIARSLAELSTSRINSGTTILSLLELEQPFFKDLKDSSWTFFKSILQDSGPILWVSSGRHSQNPYANMMVGLLRSAKQEIPTLEMQCFDIDDASTIDALDLVETLLRLKALSLWRRRDGSDSLLMTMEPELTLRANGSLIIPRIYENSEMNDRFNSSRRPIFNGSGGNGVDSNLSIAGVEEGRVCLHEVPLGLSSGLNRIFTTHSLWSAVRVSRFGLMHLVLGQDHENGSRSIALTSEHSMTVAQSSEPSISISVPEGKGAAFVLLLAYHMLAAYILEGLPAGSTILILDASKTFALVLNEVAKISGLRTKFSTTSAKPPNPDWIVVHPMTTQLALQALVPSDTTSFVDFSLDSTQSSIGIRLKGLMSGGCQYHNRDTMFGARATWTPPKEHFEDMQNRLRQCVSRALASLHEHRISASSLLLDGSPPQVLPLEPDTVIHWPSSRSSLPVRIRPADTQIALSPSKTYWLAGLSGGLGLLLCEWLIHHGARCIAISSRNPMIESAWLEKMHGLGATVMVYPWYVIIIIFWSEGCAVGFYNLLHHLLTMPVLQRYDRQGSTDRVV